MMFLLKATIKSNSTDLKVNREAIKCYRRALVIVSSVNGSSVNIEHLLKNIS